MRKRKINSISNPSTREKMNNFFESRKWSNRQIKAAEEMFKLISSSKEPGVIPQKQAKEKNPHVSLWKRLFFRK